MKSNLLLPIGLGLVGVIVVGMVLNSSLNLDIDTDTKTNLDEREVLSLAMQDTSVMLFVRDAQVSTDTQFDDGLWRVKFININSQEDFIQVIIDDDTSQILETNSNSDLTNAASKFADESRNDAYSASQSFVAQEGVLFDTATEVAIWGDYYNEYNEEEVKAAIAYLTEFEFGAELIEKYELEIYGYSYDGLIFLWGYSYQNYNLWLNAELASTQVADDEWDFSLNKISAPMKFGIPRLSFAEVEQLAQNTPEYSEFAESIKNYSTDLVLHYYPNQVLSEQYIFNIRYSPNYYSVDYDNIAVGSDSSTSNDGNGSAAGSLDGEESKFEVKPVYPYFDTNWIDIEISDYNGSILDVWGLNSSIMTQKDVFEIAKQNSEINEWLIEINSLANYTYYNGYGEWWVSFYDELDYYNYAYANVNDRTGLISEVYTILSVPATYSENQVREIIESSSESSGFFGKSSEFESYLWYDQYGAWYFSYYDVDNYFNYFWGSLNDTDGAIIELQVSLYVDPKMTANEAVDVLTNQGLDEFMQLYPDIIVSTYYNGYDTWYIYGYSLTLLEASFWAQVDDATGNVNRYEEFHPKVLPTMSTDQILKIARETKEFEETTDQLERYFEYSYFVDGKWYYYLQGSSDDTHYWLGIEIDDLTSQVTNTWSSIWSLDPDNPYNIVSTENSPEKTVTESDKYSNND